MLSSSSFRKWLYSLVLLMLAVLSLTPLVDQRATVEYEKLFQRAFVTFALARTINGVISVVQGTEVALQPAGVGVTLTPGEILDPVNDLIERFSWVMMGATVSLGIQSVLLDVSAWWLIQALVAVCAVWVAIRLWYPGQGSRFSKMLLKRFLLMLLFVRFAVPVMLIVNDGLYQAFLESRYEQSSQIVSVVGEEFKQLGIEAKEEAAQSGESGLLNSITQAWSSTIDTLDISGKLDRMQARAAEVTEHLIQLSAVFILQTALLPVAFLWFFLQLFKWLFRPAWPPRDNGGKHDSVE